MNYITISIIKCKRNQRFFQKSFAFILFSKKMFFVPQKHLPFLTSVKSGILGRISCRKYGGEQGYKFFSIAALRCKILTKLSSIFSNAWYGKNILDLTLIQFKVYTLPTRQAGSFAKNVHRTFS